MADNNTAYITTIIDKQGDIVYPRTKATAVYDENGNQISTIIDNKANIADVYTRTEIDNLMKVDTTTTI